MVYRLYDFLLLAATVFLVPFGVLKGLRYGNVRRGIGERLAFYDPERLECLSGRKVIWVHAVSVGETRASIPLIRQLRQKYPAAAIVLSSLTYTGRATADEIDEVDLRIFLPYDQSWVVKKALNNIQPDLVLLVETEIWPNFIRHLAARQIPVVVVNGRISDKSFPRYWLVRPLLRPLLASITKFCMQSRQDELRIVRLGADSGKVSVSGNLKFDLPAPDFDDAEIARFRDTLKLPGNIPVWVAGSTREGEEEIILKAYSDILEAGHQLVLILVPRYPKRARAVCEMVEKNGFVCALRSGIATRKKRLASGEVLVGDSLGEMLRFYACADVVFVGGSFVPVGGHNILEASLLQKPVLFGPYMQNFKTISRLLLENGGGQQVQPAELADTVAALITDPDRCRAMGEKGGRLFAEHSGATARTVEAVDQLLEDG